MCVVLAATSERLTGSRVLEGALVGIVAPSDLAKSILLKILHNGEGEDVEQVARIAKQFSRICDCLSFSLSNLCLIFYMFILLLSFYA